MKLIQKTHDNGGGQLTVKLLTGSLVLTSANYWLTPHRGEYENKGIIIMNYDNYKGRRLT